MSTKIYTFNIDNATFHDENLAQPGTGQIILSKTKDASVSMQTRGDTWLTIDVRETPVSMLRWMGLKGQYQGNCLYEITEPTWSDGDPEGNEPVDQWQYQGEKQADLLNRIQVEGMERIVVEGHPGVFFGVKA